MLFKNITFYMLHDKIIKLAVLKKKRSIIILTLPQQAIFFMTSDILIELFYNVNISARIHPPLKQRTPLKS